MKLAVSRKAIRDLDDIAHWSYEAFGARQSKIYIALLEKKCGLLARGRLSGRQAGDIAPHLRKLVVKSHVVYFRIEADELLVIRILHGSQDVRRHL